MKPDVPFDPALAARNLLRTARTGALATLMPAGHDPYCSLVNVASDVDGVPLMLISRLAIHTQNLLADARASLMLDERRSGDPLEGARIMIGGSFAPDTSARARRRYLAAQTEAAMYADFADFAFWRMEVRSVHLVAGFGRITDLAPAAVLTPLAGAEALIAAEADIVAHMNAEHRETMALYARHLTGLEEDAPEGGWLCTGCDPEGLDMQAGRLVARLVFPERICDPAALRNILRRLADRARRAV